MELLLKLRFWVIREKAKRIDNKIYDIEQDYDCGKRMIQTLSPRYAELNGKLDKLYYKAMDITKKAKTF